MATLVHDIESSDGECFDEQGHNHLRKQNIVATTPVHRLQTPATPVVILPADQQNGQSDDESTSAMDEQVLEAKLKSIAQAQMVSCQHALKAVKDACNEVIRHKDMTIAQLQGEVQRLQTSRQYSAGGLNSGGTGESPGYPPSRLASPFKKPQVAWNLEDNSNGLRDVAKANGHLHPPGGPVAPDFNMIGYHHPPPGTAPKMQNGQRALSAPPMRGAAVQQVQKTTKVQVQLPPPRLSKLSSMSESMRVSEATDLTLIDSSGNLSSRDVKSAYSRVTCKRVSIAESAKKAKEIAKDLGNSEDQQKATQDGGHSVFIDAAMMKERVKEAIMRPEYNVVNFYHKTGAAQWIARNTWFDNFTLCVIAFNALWIAVDTDKNKAPTLIVAHPVFIVAENSFAVYFTMEILIRFFAFKNKRDCLRDAWFVFDSSLVFFIILDTWIMSLVLIITNQGGGAGLGDASILRLVRLLRLTRMARMARLLRAFPELMILVKGISVATRSVFFTLCLLTIIIYVFGVAFAQLSEDTSLEGLYFDTVPDAMNSLLLRGVLPDQHDFVSAVGEEHLAFSVLLLFFILLSSLTVMNMLVGVLVEVVSVVSSVEKEQMTVQFVKTMILSMLQNSGLDADHNYHISRQEFESLLLKPEAARIIQEVGVDVVGLVDFADFIFKDDVELSFPELMEIVLQLRGCNTATVRDVVDLRKFILTEVHSAIADISCIITEKVEEIEDSITVLRTNSNSDALETIAADETAPKRMQARPANPEHSRNKRSPPPRNRGGGGIGMIGFSTPDPVNAYELVNAFPLPEFPAHMWQAENQENHKEKSRAGRLYA